MITDLKIRSLVGSPQVSRIECGQNVTTNRRRYQVDRNRAWIYVHICYVNVVERLVEG